ncbi:MAG: zinc metallopeptidase [Clostridia bacterium]|nr:zinc metallopeptidase [Clostridia bacterium]
MYYGYYGNFLGFDSVTVWQLLLIIIPFALCLGAQILVKSRYKKFSRIANARNLTGAQAAYELLQANGVTNVQIARVQGQLTDNYNPRTNTISLSEGVYDSTSIAAIGIACHEAGHACQYAENYFPIKVRSKVIPAANIGSSIGLPLCIIGLIFSSFSFLFTIGIILYSTVFLFQLITLPVEFNASSRALKTIRERGLLQEQEYAGAKSVLTAAALTYVASMASSLLTMVRLLLLNGRRK